MRILATMLLVVLVGCASKSSRVVADLNTESDQYQSLQCQDAIRHGDVHDSLKYIRMITSPLVVIATGGIALPIVIAGNAGAEYADRRDASRTVNACGGVGQTDSEIQSDVLGGILINTVTSAVSPPVVIVQPATTTTK